MSLSLNYIHGMLKYKFTYLNFENFLVFVFIHNTYKMKDSDLCSPYSVYVQYSMLRSKILHGEK